ncbi:unnamed protein product, partial [Symbiodinium pilosum]
MAPRSFYDCFEPDFVSWVKDNAEDQAAMALAATAFPAEVRDELEQPSELSFDTVEGSEDIAREAIQQDLELDEAEVHNLPASEQERREGRKQLPQRIRGALRRLHRQFGHCPHKVLINLLRAAKVDKAYVDDAKLLRCAECEEAAPRRPAHKALAHQVLNEEPVIPDAIARGNQEFEDHRGAQPETPVEEPQVEEEDPFDLPLASIMEEEEAPNEPVRMRTVRTDALDRAEGSERSVRPRHESRVEPEAERPPSRRASSYDITDDLPEQIRSQLADAHTAQFGDLSGTMTKKQCQTWTAFKAFMANRVLTKEQVEHQQREEYKRLPGLVGCGNFEDATGV